MPSSFTSFCKVCRDWGREASSSVGGQHASACMWVSQCSSLCALHTAQVGSGLSESQRERVHNQIAPLCVEADGGVQPSIYK